MRFFIFILLLGLAMSQASGQAKRLPPLQCLDSAGKVVVPAAAIRQVGKGVLPPEIVKQVWPAWPKGAPPYGITIIESVIDVSGNVCAVRVVKASSKAVGEAAMAAVREFKFKPAKFNGKGVAVRYLLAVSPHIQP
ncbi:MAG TPA: TonB family protein [Thermoanaerobaculia bacterium]|nr:TonB family protein [Thermoanaerobaculia bacterium]